MLKTLISTIFANSNKRYIKSLQRLVNQINGLEERFVAMSDEEMRACTSAYKSRLEHGETLDDLLPEAFALVREAAKRTLGQRHYDVQLMGGIVLHKGMIAEMKTGEGKTLVATLPTYLNALTGKGVHVVTVNDYLAHRDRHWVGQVHEFLGLTVSVITHDLSEEERRVAYQADVTYTTNHELGFDYLRDNMKLERTQLVQRPFHYAIIDEVDSILIDEARTPLIISGPSEDRSELYMSADLLVRDLDREDFEVDEKHKSASFTDAGLNKLEPKLINLNLISPGSSVFDSSNIHALHHLNQALKAHKLFKNDVDYIVRRGEVVLIDEFTGRIMDGRRLSDGLHQAIEAKEHVAIQSESQTLASITYQNYFRLYPRLAGMTGTAVTEKDEFRAIYGLDVISIPTKNPMIRQDQDDVVYRTFDEKVDAIVAEIRKAHERGQPVLVGTISIEKSEQISERLAKEGIPHQVLNAKHHEQEARIIAQAGRVGAVTIATNMAGRGTDILLGGNPDMQSATPDQFSTANLLVSGSPKEEVLQAGGLLVIGTERHESRRIDNQLRGRSGRMGDPGRSIFFLSLEDDLMRIFASERTSKILKALGMKDGESIVHPLITRSIGKAQQKVEMRNYESRKSVLKFDDVVNEQRRIVYQQRSDILFSEDIWGTVQQINADLAQDALTNDQLLHELAEIYEIDLSDRVDIGARMQDLLKSKRERMGADAFDRAASAILLSTLDHVWKDHLLSLDYLRRGIHLRSYGQKDPLNEFKKEAFHHFEEMLGNLRRQFIERLSGFIFISSDNVSRNESCPCGSGMKYKHCHGALCASDK